jgi:hypothetical protein
VVAFGSQRNKPEICIDAVIIKIKPPNGGFILCETCTTASIFALLILVVVAQRNY